MELATKLGRAEPWEEAVVVLVPQGSLYAVEAAEVLPGFDWGLAVLPAPTPSAPLGKEGGLQIEEHCPPLAFSGAAGEGEVQNPLVTVWEALGWYLERISRRLELQAGHGI